ncbi:cytochrome c oxidase subunit II [Natronomonas amylolytica]|uniref:cytochrome c oxidase subunit II n=1 Tax=Natronomonas amylolytica TaxID=3108498 RepID=UPI00300A5C74
MSADDTVPDESGSAREAVFWSVVILVGLAAFLYDFLRVVLSDVPAAQPIEIIHSFQQTMFLIAILGGGITVALIAYAIFTYGAGRRSRAFMPDVQRGRFMLAVFAIGMTFLMVTTMFVGASTLVQTDEASADTAAAQLDVDRQLDVRVTASQWFWRFDVDGMSDTQGERVVVPAGTVVNLEITSADVIHSFAIQELGVKKDALPGQVNDAWFYVEEVDGETTIEAGDEQLAADTYTVTCAELCGKGHSKMLATVYVVSPEDYEHWAEENGGEVPESFQTEENGGEHGDEDEH